MTDEDTEPLLSIGARNPFVCAEHKLGEKIKWNEMRPGQKRKKLEDAFDGMSYDQLFDSRNESPLFVGDTRPCTPYPVSRWGPIPEGTFGTREYNDPVQGNLPDCYLIAPLSSLAFLNMIPLKQPLLPPEPPNTYEFKFYNPPAGAPIPTAPVKITYNLPLDATGSYRYSKSFTAREIWVAMYEKAFASWKGSKTDTPDYSLICTGDPMLALMSISGWKYSTTSKYSTLNMTGIQIYDTINLQCKNSLYNAIVYRTAAKPMVAYTYDPRIESPPPGVTYTDATIVANHAYSVLGVHTIGAEKYIVMRNPWGQKGTGPGLGDPDPSSLPSGALASGAWYRVAELSDPNDAVFALKSDVFKKYFKGFGWVYQ
jgi:hypothetical protein